MAVSVWLPLDRVLVVMAHVSSSITVIMPTTIPLSYRSIGKALRRDAAAFQGDGAVAHEKVRIVDRAGRGKKQDCAAIHCARASSVRLATPMAIGQCVKLKLACYKACDIRLWRQRPVWLLSSIYQSKAAAYPTFDLEGDWAGPCIIPHYIKNR